MNHNIINDVFDNSKLKYILRREDPSSWDIVFNKLEYKPLDYLNWMIDYEFKYRCRISESKNHEFQTVQTKGTRKSGSSPGVRCPPGRIQPDRPVDRNED